MKKLRLGLAALSVCLFTTVAVFSVPVLAEEVALKSSHPDRYTVLKGDTLWDISAKFLEKPWLWPEIWQVNPQIENPHLIYPGDTIALVYIDGRPRLVVQRGDAGRTFKMSPEVRIQPLEAAIPAIPLDAINHFLDRSRVLDEGELERAPYVVMGGEDHLVVGAGDNLYARGDFTDRVPVYGIYRGGKAYTDPDSGELLGIKAEDMGAAKFVAAESDIATLTVTRSSEEIRIEDRLLPHEERAIDSTFYPSPPAEEIDAEIMSVEGGISQVGALDVVSINRGEREGLKSGNVLAIYRKGSVVTDRVSGDKIKLPDERAGLLMVFHTFEKMSFAIVLESSRPLKIRDRVRNP